MVEDVSFRLTAEEFKEAERIASLARTIGKFVMVPLLPSQKPL
jgi:hypothetical protein